MYIKIILTAWLLASVIGLLFFSHQYYQFYSTKFWTPIDAKIIESNTNSYKGGGVSKGPRYISYDLKVKYDYHIGSNIFRSTNVYFPIEGFKSFASTTSFELSQELLQKYKKGETVKAYYNPKKRSQSVLINKPPRGNIFIPIIFSLFLALGIFNFFRYIKSQSKLA